MDVINRQAAIKDAESWVAVDEYEKHLQRDVIKWLKKFPSAQSEIIYCRDCKYKDDGIDENGIPFLKCLYGRSYGGTRINDFCSWAEKKEDAESRWIPVTEKLPEEDKDVLCKTLAGVIFVASYGKLHRWTDEKGWIITPSLERAGISFVDWWMPLPEFYKEGEK